MKNEKIKLVLILEMIGYFNEKDNTQDYPINFLKYLYPEKGNFIAIVSNFSNILQIRKTKSIFKSYLEKNNLIGVKSINAPNFVNGINFSDHRNYWKFNIPAIMITDTAFYRNKNYHTKFDTYETLNYKKMSEVVKSTILTVLNY